MGISFSEANSLHKNFYENELTGEIVEKMAEDVKQLIAKLKGGEARRGEARRGEDMTMELLSKRKDIQKVFYGHRLTQINTDLK